MAYEYAKYVPVIKALSDETRLKIIDMLSCGELCACKILERFSITQPTLSYHMRILTECGIVTGRRDGAWMHYHLNNEKMGELTRFLTVLTSFKEDCICNRCNNKSKAKG
ncbi:MAG: metalloregulator ArsR/SmtB family transcription factor [Eubacteriales bacterium]|nr:metalloregulator ArsR/SmtB family transcription factor [Eubacteriales bacterium]